jgi:hypothetical protein
MTEPEPLPVPACVARSTPGRVVPWPVLFIFGGLRSEAVRAS